MWEIANKLKILYQALYFCLHRTVQTGSNQNRKRSGRPWCTTEQEDKYIRVSSLRNRCLTSPQLAASWNSTRKTPASTSTVKRRLRDAGLLGRVAKKKPYFRLANKKKRLRWAKEHRHWTEELCLEGQHPRVTSSLLTLRLVFCGYFLMKLPCEESVSTTRHSNVLVLLFSCALTLSVPRPQQKSASNWSDLHWSARPALIFILTMKCFNIVFSGQPGLQVEHKTIWHKQL